MGIALIDSKTLRKTGHPLRPAEAWKGAFQMLVAMATPSQEATQPGSRRGRRRLGAAPHLYPMRDYAQRGGEREGPPTGLQPVLGDGGGTYLAMTPPFPKLALHVGR